MYLHYEFIDQESLSSCLVGFCAKLWLSSVTAPVDLVRVEVE